MAHNSEETKAVVVQELPRLRRFAYSLTGSKADADDLVQNVVMRVLKAGIPGHDNAIAWMLRICKNCWIDEIRSRASQAKVVDSLQAEGGEASSSEKQVSDQLHIEKVTQAMSALPDQQRLALSLVAIEGMSYAETAKVLEVPIGTVMSRVARARENLHQYMHSKTEELTK